MNQAIPNAVLPGELVARVAKLQVSGLGREFRQRNGQPLQALKDVNFSIEAGGFYTLIGHSGCGKSTLLNIIAGLDQASQGEVRVDGVVRRDPGPDRGMVFQSYTLFPWLSVLDNVAFGLRMRGVSKAEQRDTAMHYLKLVKLEQFAQAYPRQLSGGMRQRVALARAIANRPAVLLMDEPFGALDAETREHMHELLLAVREREFMTVLFITHDIEEAVLLSERIGIMAARPGRIIHEFKVDLPYPRTAQTKLSDAFLDNKRQVIELFRAPISTESIA
jgi:ABC-type nitrate/sulfonate/bicarbonate transport system ATPase subunit